MADKHLFTWLHLSDIHSGAGKPAHRWDQRMVMGQLERDLARVLKEDVPQPDAVLVTGDLAFSGNNLSKNEYPDVEAWLGRVRGLLGLEPRDIYLVPGNHDVDRSVAKTDPEAKKLLGRLRQGKRQVEEAMETAGDLACLQTRLKGYIDLTGRQHLTGTDVNSDGDLCWSRRFKARGNFGIQLVGLNTALLSQDKKDKEHLRLGNRQLALVQKEDEEDLVILLTHHPLDWLADAKDARGWVRNLVEVHLYGHVHDADNESLRAGGARHGRVEVVAGAVHGDEGEPKAHGFSIGSIVRCPRGLVVRIWPYKWSDKNKDFRPDMDNLKSGRPYAEHVLREGDRLTQILVPNTAAVKAKSPAALLNARYEVVPFFEDSRRKELDVLESWCGDSTPASVRLFFGPGGTGKTRLFVEWTKRLREKHGWAAGFLSEGINEQDVETILNSAEATFVVVDYAETRPTLLGMLKQVAARAADRTAPLRVALLAREVTDWWHSLLQLDADVRHLLTEHDPVRLEEIPMEGPLRERIFAEAREAFAEHRGKKTAGSMVDLTDRLFARMLYLHMAALAVVEGLSPEAESLLDEVVTHEKHFWVRAFRDRIGGDLRPSAEFLRRASRTVVAVTLRGGSPSKENAVLVCRSVEGPAEEEFVPFIRDLYPGRAQGTNDRYLGALEPDLLGEWLVASVLRDANTPEDYLDRVFEGAPATALLSGFVVLGRIALRGEEQARDWLRQVLNADIAGRVRPAFDAAMALGGESAFGPLGFLLFEALSREGTFEHAAELEPLIPEYTVSLREVGVWATERLLKAKPDPVERSRLLNNLGNRLGELGRREEALGTAEETAKICRKLAKSRPEAFLPHLAGSLHNLGGRLSELGRREEALGAAEQATEIYRRLAKDRPDAFLPGLAGSLNNLGAMLSELGRREEALGTAEEGTEIYRRLAKDRPDAFLPDLAMSLNNLGAMLSKLGRREEALGGAEEATEIYRKLARDRPDAFQSYLAMSLNNLGATLRELGRREEALGAAGEGTEICRKLARDRPDAFLPDLAMGLNNLGAMLSDLGRREEALGAAEEATSIYRKLAKDRPETFLPDLAMSLNSLANMLSEQGRGQEALGAVEEATSIYGKLAKERPDAFLPGLAMSLNNLGAMLSYSGHREEALGAEEEATSIYRKLAKDRPEAFLPHLAGSLHNLGKMLSDLGRREKALGAAEEATDIYGRLVESLPAAFGRSFLISLRNLAERFEECGRPKEVEPAVKRALELAKRLGLEP